MIIERKIKKRFIAQARIEIAKNPRLLKKMVKAGFKLLLLGIESPHDYILKQFNKGFDSNTIRESFRVLRNYPIYYHGYFIFGNIGETEKEMMCIPKFAKEIGVDSITYNKLRIDKFSPLRELAIKTPGYHVTDRGELYSDMYSHDALKKIGKRIRFAFYTPYRLFKIGIKLIRVRANTFREIIALLAISPVVFKNIIVKELQKGRLIATMKGMFKGSK